MDNSPVRFEPLKIRREKGQSAAFYIAGSFEVGRLGLEGGKAQGIMKERGRTNRIESTLSRKVVQPPRKIPTQINPFLYLQKWGSKISVPYLLFAQGRLGDELQECTGRASICIPEHHPHITIR